MFSLEPKISVVIPTWNREKLLEQAIMSALSQSLPVLEILVCDDGSTDQSAAAVKTIADPRVRWIDGEHSGLPACPRNRGLRNAKGDWIAFLDSDDEWIPDKIEQQLKLLYAQRRLASCSNAIRFVPLVGRNGRLLQFGKTKITFHELLHGNPVVASSSLVHKSVVQACGFFSETSRLRGIEDYAYWLRVATKTDLVYHSEPLVVYTDDPAKSIRALDSGDGLRQKQLVLRDFLMWAHSRANAARINPRILLLAVAHYLQLDLNRVVGRSLKRLKAISRGPL